MKKMPHIVLLLSFVLTVKGSLAGSASWSSRPINGQWTEPANWTPNTVPNGPNDVATFATSSQINVQIPDGIELDRMVFQPGASAFTFRIRSVGNAEGVLTLSGAGIINNSGLIQNFVLDKPIPYLNFLIFQNSASAGTLTNFTVGEYDNIDFYDTSSAGSGNFVLDASSTFARGGYAIFHEQATAADATITANDGANGIGAIIFFEDLSSAGNAVLTANGTNADHQSGASIRFDRGATPAAATIIVNGISKNSGGSPDLSAAYSSLATGHGEAARVELFGNGFLDMSFPRVGAALGSIEGDGIVYVGANAVSVGDTNLSTSFSGATHDRGISGQRGGSINKVGIGTLTLSGTSDYPGGTTLSEGFLRIENAVNSGTGSGPVQVNGGTLGGGGIISGSLTVGSGTGLAAFVAPGNGASILTSQNALTFKSDGTYLWRVKTSGPSADKLVANGVTIESGAQIEGVGQGRLTNGTVLTAINNTSGSAISGTFANLPDGGTLKIGRNNYQANYEGGDGNDLTLAVVQ